MHATFFPEPAAGIVDCAGSIENGQRSADQNAGRMEEAGMKTYSSERGAVHLTLAGRLLIFLVGLGVLGYAAWTYRDRLPIGGKGKGRPAAREEAGSSRSTPAPQTASGTGGVLARIRQ